MVNSRQDAAIPGPRADITNQSWCSFILTCLDLRPKSFFIVNYSHSSWSDSRLSPPEIPTELPHISTTIALSLCFWIWLVWLLGVACKPLKGRVLACSCISQRAQTNLGYVVGASKYLLIDLSAKVRFTQVGEGSSSLTASIFFVLKLCTVIFLALCFLGVPRLCLQGSSFCFCLPCPISPSTAAMIGTLPGLAPSNFWVGPPLSLPGQVDIRILFSPFIYSRE